ncbi:MAG: hypothetical protein JXA25_20425 [Anaerolineales bacterium]|nr:hypothetical protein [Anaerolineales bacterium]
MEFKKWLEKRVPPLSALARNMVWTFDPRGRRSRVKLRAMKDIHSGERCVLIGNGPSLQNTDLSLLYDEVTFSLNRGYLFYDRIGKPCTYHVTVNGLVVEQFHTELDKLDNTRFITWGQRHPLSRDTDTIFIGGPMLDLSPRFCVDPTRDLWTGATVTYVALQIAYFLGFSQVILIGVDHNFTTPGEANREVVSGGADPNHFHPDYFGKGVRWQLPDLETSEIAYQLARQAYEADGREILDATVGGKLTVFPKVDYVQVLEQPYLSNSSGR